MFICVCRMNTKVNCSASVKGAYYVTQNTFSQFLRAVIMPFTILNQIKHIFYYGILLFHQYFYIYGIANKNKVLKLVLPVKVDFEKVLIQQKSFQFLFSYQQSIVI